MKMYILTLVCGISLITHTGWCSDFPEFSLAEMVLTTMESWQQQELQGILRIDQGERLPFTLSVEGSVLALREPPEPFILEALQTIYIKIDKNDFTFSLDKTEWKTFEEQFSGEFGLSAGNCDEGPFGTIYAKLNLK